MKAGLSCKLYHNSASWASPTYDEITRIREATLEMTFEPIDATTREDSVEVSILSVSAWSLNFKIPWNPADTDFAALYAAHVAGTAIELLALDGSSAVAGNKGVRAMWNLTKFTRPEPLKGLVESEVEAVPAWHATQKPAHHTTA